MLRYIRCLRNIRSYFVCVFNESYVHGMHIDVHVNIHADYILIHKGSDE